MNSGNFSPKLGIVLEFISRFGQGNSEFHVKSEGENFILSLLQILISLITVSECCLVVSKKSRKGRELLNPCYMQPGHRVCGTWKEITDTKYHKIRTQCSRLPCFLL